MNRPVRTGKISDEARARIQEAAEEQFRRAGYHRTSAADIAAGLGMSPAISIHGIPDWASEGEVRTTGVPFRTTDAEAQFVAVRQGLGITTLPCFIGDADPLR
jgi:DNA-binding transcriptional LysR family regulator